MKENPKGRKLIARKPSPLSGKKPMGSSDWGMFWLFIGMLFVLFILIYETQPPKPM